jgi:Ras-related protein Rab-1A
MGNNDYDYLFKIILIGDSGVGKSSITDCYTKKDFKSSHISTIGVDFEIVEQIVNDKLVKLQIWDTAGSERFDSITTSYYRGAHGILIVYDVSDKGSFESVKNKWLVNVRKYTSRDVFIIVVGNKCDLIDVETYEKEDMLELDNIRHVFTSAKDKINVFEIFEDMMKNMISKTIFNNKPEKESLSLSGVIPVKKACCY